MSEKTPKRILALDGGGIRGALTLGFLERIEAIIREKEGNPDLLLCEYFDLIGGTSTGAIIAAGLSIGMTASEIKDLYMSIGGDIFGRKNKFWKNPVKWYRASYDFAPLEAALYDVFKNIKLGDSENIKTGLCIVTKRADTYSTWPLINHPGAKYFDYNKDLYLRDVVRASAAAPTYFRPKQLEVGTALKPQTATFIDGGLSLANNPALQLFLIATLNGFPYHWETGADKLELVSVGTGVSKKKEEADKVAKYGLADWAKSIPEFFMEDANFFNQTMLQYLSSSPTAISIDREVGTLDNDLLTREPALHYLRYNVVLSQEVLKSLGLELSDEKVDSVKKMDRAENKELLYEIGGKAAQKYISPGHFN